jgi:hypothetical protein
LPVKPLSLQFLLGLALPLCQLASIALVLLFIAESSVGVTTDMDNLVMVPLPAAQLLFLPLPLNME